MKYLFHASPKSGIKKFKPQRKSFRNAKEGAVIFAASSKAIASTFLVKWDDDWVEMGLWGKSPYLVVSDAKRFLKNDKGGSIYTLPKERFFMNAKEGLGAHEWISKQEALPVKEERYFSGIEAMLKSKVKIYFIDKKTFKKIQNASDHGFSVLKKLKPLEVSK